MNNSIPSSVTSDTALALTGVSYLGWYRGESTAGAKRVTYGTFGNPTPTAEVPTTSTVTYSLRAAGRTVIARTTGASGTEALAGTVTAVTNFATGQIQLTINLTRAGGAAYGTFTGTGSISSGSNRFTGTFTNGTVTGTFQGQLYGAAAGEMGLTFAVSGVQVAGSNSAAVGTMVGRKN